METVTLDAFFLEAPRNRQQPGYTRHFVMKCRIETDDLWQTWKALLETFNQLDFRWEMLRVNHANVMKQFEKRWRDKLRPMVVHPVDDSMTNRRDVIQPDFTVQPFSETALRLRMIFGLDEMALAIALFPTCCPLAFGVANAADFPGEQAAQSSRAWKQSELDTGGTCVESENHDYFANLRRRAFTATMTVLADISTAPMAGVSRMP